MGVLELILPGLPSGTYSLGTVAEFANYTQLMFQRLVALKLEVKVSVSFQSVYTENQASIFFLMMLESSIGIRLFSSLSPVNLMFGCCS